MTNGELKTRLSTLLLGPPKDPSDPSVFKHLSLIALLAWVGLGADGLSSACYGPEATFRALGDYRHLAPYLVLATVVTVSVLSAAYATTIEAFPSGGGGYVVASRTLGRPIGMLCGCALILDYVLTIAISVAAGADAIFSFFPPSWQAYKVWAAVGGTLFLMLLNFRGVKESVLFLLPIFVLFLMMHALLIGAAIMSPVPQAAPASHTPLGLGLAMAIVFKAYAHGAGTYTGIEAVSNSLNILREPRIQTARRAMLYMAISLSVVAGGLLVGYLRFQSQPALGQTLNAVLAGQVFGPSTTGRALTLVTLISEATLLLVAAQAGFISGPRLMASMAVDSWVPRWLSRLSDRLVISNGVMIMGLGGLGAILLTLGHVDKLVIVYSFSVFVTFLLSQSGMTRYWLTHRENGWVWRAVIASVAALLSLAVLGSLLASFGWGGAGVAAACILGLGVLCLLIRRHYASVTKMLARLRSLPEVADADPYRRELQARDPNEPTAVFLVSGYNGMGLHMLMNVQRLFPNYFRQMVFVSVGLVDFDRFKGDREIVHLRRSVEETLARYVVLVKRWGYPAEMHWSVGTDVVVELTELCERVHRDYPRAIFFCGDLVFQIPTFITRLLHDGTAQELTRRLHTLGLPVLPMPIRVSGA
jgi:amino acid transporter